MKNYYRVILYVVIILIILGGLALFLFRQPLTESLNSQISPESLVSPAKVANPSANVLDVDILKTPKFTALKNNVVNFDFDNICGRASSDGSAVTIVSGTSTVAASRCGLGNNFPFFINNK